MKTAISIPDKGFEAAERAVTKLGKESVINVLQIITLDKSFLSQKVGKLSSNLQEEVDDGLKLIFAL